MSQPAPPHAAEERTRPEVEYTQEVRFAVVMYGGSSLAIYMNGVAQELLRLVRATAPGRDGRTHRPAEELQGSERAYRKLGQILARGEASPPSAEGVGDADPVRTRFVIDILTGTSAGGINAVYLAKALANDQPLDDLKQLWIDEGDIGVLLNDAKSDEQLGLGGQNPPGSLLNSRRMYLMLLEALRGMDDKRKVGEEEESPLVDELDLYVTSTDMLGRLLPLRLADGVAHERRHRSVFHFRYFTELIGGKHRNDFLPAYNPFLAFASRSTSAHQAAFEVMRLADIEQALVKFPPRDGAREHGVKSDELKKFYEEYLPPAGSAPQAGPAKTVAFPDRSFSDGGVLDNSPFSFASDALPFRHADAPVDRKLIYIEPSPEHPEWEEESAERPDFFRNALMALSTLPRYQTIVEDLVRVLERNRLIERVNHIVLGLENDLKWKREQGWHDEPPSLRELFEDPAALRRWADEKRRDISWGGYQRLRVAETTDDLTLLVARAAGFDEDSDEFTAVRYLVRDWREVNYPTDPQPGERLQVEFLLRFDLMWLVRRVKFVLSKINEISCFDERARQVLDAAGARELWEKGGRPDRESREAMRGALLTLKRRVAEAFTGLRVARQRLWTREEGNVFPLFVAALGVSSADLLELLKRPTSEARREYAKELLSQPLGPAAKGHLREASQLLAEGGERARLEKLLGEAGGRPTRSDAVRALTEKVRQELEAAVEEARGRCREALDPAAAGRGGAGDFEQTFRAALWYYYRHFDDYDLVSYPILHATDVGEELDPVEVFRISPEDATFLVNEKEKRVHKLAGTTLGHFGAFFEERFRRNDILWGRLDAAERVIRALLPNDAQKSLRDELTYEAQRDILAEEAAALLSPGEKAELGRLAAEGLGRAAAGGGDAARRGADLAARLEAAAVHPSLRIFLRSFLAEGDTAGKIKKFRGDFLFEFEKNYEAERAFTPRATVINAGRASRVFGRMVEGIASSRRRGNKLVLWLVRLTRWTWGLAEVAIPDTIGNLVARHLLRVLYLFEVALVVLGVVFASKEVQRFGLAGLVITAALHVALLLIGDYVRGGGHAKKSELKRRFFLRAAVVAAAFVALAMLIYFTNSYWLPSVLQYFIDLLADWKKQL